MARPFQARRDRVIQALSGSCDGFLTAHGVNVRYLTGFTGSNGAVLLTADRPPLLATDGRYLTQAAEEAPDLECVAERGVAAALVARARALGVRRLGIEPAQVSLTLHRALLAAADGQLELVPVEGVVERLRAVKDVDELATLARACAITDAAFADVVATLAAGVSEREVAWGLRAAIRAHGGDGLAFDTIVAFGPNSAIPHHQPSERVLQSGDLVKMDFGARLDGYHADMTRTVVLGVAAGWQRELYGQVQAIQAAARGALAVGAVPAELDRQAHDAIVAAGFAVSHGLGHGVGLEIHEQPMLVPGSTAPPLVAAVPVTIEPGIYLPGRGGVRIEDTMVVDAAGAHALTQTPRDLVEIAG